MKKVVDVAVLDERKIKKIEVEFLCPFDIILDDTFYIVELVYDSDTKKLKGFVYEESKKNIIKYVVQNLKSLNLPQTLDEYYNIYNDIKHGMVTWCKAGGNAGKNSISNKISIPYTWLNVMNISEDNREVKMTFNGNHIIIEKI